MVCSDCVVGKSHFIRPAYSRDLPRIIDIENESFVSPLSKSELVDSMKERRAISLVVVDERDVIAGFCVYRIIDHGITIDNLAVAHGYRRKGFATAFMNRIDARAIVPKRVGASVMLVESNVVGQLFFRSQGFLCVDIAKRLFGDRDGYLFHRSFNRG